MCSLCALVLLPVATKAPQISSAVRAGKAESSCTTSTLRLLTPWKYHLYLGPCLRPTASRTASNSIFFHTGLALRGPVQNFSILTHFASSPRKRTKSLLQTSAKMILVSHSFLQTNMTSWERATTSWHRSPIICLPWSQFHGSLD